MPQLMPPMAQESQKYSLSENCRMRPTIVATRMQMEHSVRSDIYEYITGQIRR